MAQRRHKDAVVEHRRAIALEPDAAELHSTMILNLQYHPDQDAKSILTECRRWNQHHADPLRESIKPHVNRAEPERRLRIGYVSPDFREHVDSFFTIPLLSNHDHRQYEIFCYADVGCPDSVTERLRGYADVWRSTVGLSDEQVAEMIRKDQIDILVDLELHMAKNRLLVFARKPAPVQVTWLGCPSTTGLSTMDYRLTDPYLNPPGLLDDCYSEEAVRLPDTFWCYDPLVDVPAINDLPALQNGFLTFGCLNFFAKINDRCLELWARVIREASRSRLILRAPRGRPRDVLLAKLQLEGVSPGRIEFVDALPRREYFELYRRIDVTLDPFPYNGHTTSLDAFWMGVPTLTLVSDKTAFGRAGWSQLCNLGLREFAAQTPEQFVALAARVAADVPRLGALRTTLRQRMQQSPLMDSPRFARNMEHAYRQMWRRWCQQSSPISTISAPETSIATPSVQESSLTAWEHFDAGRSSEAEQIYQAHMNLGLALEQQGNDRKAEASFQQAVRLEPRHVEAHFHVGRVLGKQGKLEEAVTSFRQALHIKPDHVEAHVNLGVALQNQGRIDEAIASWKQALHYGPNFVTAHTYLGHVLRDQGRLDEAIAAFRAAVALEPDDPGLLSNIILASHLHPDYDARAIYEGARHWNQKHAEPLKRFIRPHTNVPLTERRLRIGYVSPDFREHVDSFFTLPLLSNHDRRQFEIYCYAHLARPDAITERLRGYADVWRSTIGLTDEQVAEMIRNDQIDILVDLELHVANNRLTIFARKPAPVQVAWLGYPGTTGLSAMDYRLTDPYLDPPGLFESFYSEESVRLPDTFWCYDPLANEPAVNPLPALTNGFITFGCLNNFSKVNDVCLTLWAQVMHAAPHSHFLILAPRGEARDRVLAKFAREDIAASRIKFADKQPRSEYLKLYHRIDLGLDPSPYNGHTTSLDALWMGVPSVSLVSNRTAFGRAGWSQLNNLGLAELTAETPEKYVARAAQLCADLPRLQVLRGALRERMQQSPLMDGKRFALNVERAFRQMWRRWCAQTKPATVPQPALLNRSTANQELGNPAVSFQQLIETAWTYYKAGRLQDAEKLFLEILQKDPDNVDTLNVMGVIAGQTDRNDLAIGYLESAFRLDPDSAQVSNNLGNALTRKGEVSRALISYQRALRLKPDYAEAYGNQANAFREQGQLDEALASYRSALKLNPNDASTHSTLILTLHYHPGYDAAAYLEECRRWNQQHAEPLRALIRPHTNPSAADRRLRIGYVSGDFRDHVDSFFTVPLLSNHDRSQCMIFCYSNVAKPDALTERVRGYAEVWRSTVGLTDEQVADLIRNDQIDVLVDLEMHVANNQMLVFARKPAPVQVAWLGYPGTTGLATMDYRLTDPYLDPPGLLDAYYSEESIRLPDTFWCYDPLTSEPAVNALPALHNGFLTFGCLNTFCKVNDGCLSLWAKVLHAAPRSRLILRAPLGSARDHVLSRLQHEGIDCSRVEFVETQPRLDYLKIYHRIDLGLDPLPCNGHTTSLDACWMGVPTLTLVSTKTAFGRAGWSQLCNLGLQELAAQSPEQFVAIAAKLSTDLSRLQELRATLRERLQRSPLMDGKRFAFNVEEAYRRMWRRWRASVEALPTRPAPRQGNDNFAIAIPQLLEKAWKLYQTEQLQAAEPLYLEILQADAKQVDALHFLGLIAARTKRADLAIDYLNAVVRQDPNCAEAHCNLGNVWRDKENWAEAVASYDRALLIKPEFGDAHFNRGYALQKLGKLVEAVESYQHAQRLCPKKAEIPFNQGIALWRMRKLDQAEASLRQALDLDPAHAAACHSLGITLKELGRLSEAEASCQRALQLKPDYAEAHLSLGNLFKIQGRLDEAIAAYRKALELEPDSAFIRSSLILTTHYHPGYDAKAIHAECRRWNQQHAEPLKAFIRPLVNSPDPERKLRIGYVSPDFREHVDAFFLAPLLSNHDRKECEIFCYSDVAQSDSVTEILRGYTDTWRTTVGLSDERVADRIRDDQIDVLVDLELHMAHNRLLVFARKPAPVQVAWLGYPGTTGLSTMDYRLTDPYLDPPGLFDGCYSEESIRLPDTFWCYDPLNGEPLVNALPALQNGFITFGCLNAFCKINDECLALWARVLRATPESRLLLRAPAGLSRERVAALLEREGIARVRLEFADTLPRQEYLKLYSRIDICLDPLPCNGHTTSLDAFWMGVPTLTLVSQGDPAFGTLKAGANCLSTQPRKH